jgi:asparagine synthase (glutamine-hydrolysing)
MSGIAGIFELEGKPASTDDLTRMVQALANRGPDAQTIWSCGNVGLGSCMLHSTPESLHEVFSIELNGIHITADARIDNRGELISALASGKTFGNPVTDGTLILLAYLKWGEKCVNRLLGDFAFAIWDPAKQQLFCARDHFGVKPFYYSHQVGRRFTFASSIKALGSASRVGHEIDEDKIVDFILEQFDDKSRTFYSGVFRLPPASFLVVDPSGIGRKTYWELDPHREVRFRSDQEYGEAFRSIFLEAVKCRLRSAFPVGAMLSGGLDSSSVACVAHDLMASASTKKIHTFSIVFDRLSESDERPFIDKVLHEKQFESHFIDGDAITPFDDLVEVLGIQDEPFCAPNYALTRKVWQRASNCGVRVLLDGLFGDNVVSHGVEHLNELASCGRWIALANELKQLIGQGLSDVSLWHPLANYILKEGVKPHVPEAVLNLWRRFRRYPLNPTRKDQMLFSAEFAERTGVRDRLMRAYADSRIAKRAAQAHRDSMGSGMIQTALEIYSNGCSEFPLETRFPFMDKRLVEFCVAIPGTQKIAGGYTRAILRRGLAGYLPKDIQLRSSKGDLGWSFIEGFRAQRKLVTRTLGSSKTFWEKFFNPGSVNQMISRMNNDKIMPEEFFTLFLLVVLSTWGSARFDA